MNTYGHTIVWRHWRGSTSVTVDGCATPEQARDEAIRFAIQSGWTRPRWWQWWRWGDRLP